MYMYYALCMCIVYMYNEYVSCVCIMYMYIHSADTLYIYIVGSRDLGGRAGGYSPTCQPAEIH